MSTTRLGEEIVRNGEKRFVYVAENWKQYGLKINMPVCKYFTEDDKKIMIKRHNLVAKYLDENAEDRATWIKQMPPYESENSPGNSYFAIIEKASLHYKISARKFFSDKSFKDIVRPFGYFKDEIIDSDLMASYPESSYELGPINPDGETRYVFFSYYIGSHQLNKVTGLYGELVHRKMTLVI